MFFAAALVLIVISIYIGKWGFTNMASSNADSTELADLLIGLAPSDPQTHYSAAVLYNKKFLPADQERSVSEYRTAVELSPNNYILWLEYAKALDRSGEREQAEAALKEALRLAPNYASVEWALGNLLIRNGDVDAGFAYIKKAVDGNPAFAGAAASFAYQFFDGDLAKTRQVAGDSPRANAALALLLAKQKRLDEAIEIWQSVPNPASDDSTLTAGHSLFTELVAAKKFAAAMRVNATLDPEFTGAPEKLHDGGFEDAVKLDGATLFEWQIGAGNQPQILQSTSQVHGGSRCLVLRFNSPDGAALRQISQTVVVRKGAGYTLSGFYRSDLAADQKLTVQVANAANNASLGESQLNPSPGWNGFNINFHIPDDTDGIVVNIMLKPCGGAICPVNGSASFDDLGLTAK